MTTAQTAHASAGQTGYDISSPQCSGTALGATPSSHGSFDILGVNAGVVYSPNPCLAAQYEWATGPPAAAVSFYANTADPGPQSRHWPAGQASPRPCPVAKHYRTGTKLFADCSYDYGWNAAASSFTGAVNATPSGVPASAQWWLDVESANSWTSDRTANIADIQGGLDYLKSVVVDDALGICAELEADMERHVATYECEWKATIESEERVARFHTFVNSDETDSNVVFIRERGQPRPARPDEREQALIDLRR